MIKRIPFIILLYIHTGLHIFLSAQITPHEAAVQMQKGINMGNTLEPPNIGDWNNPDAQEYYFNMYANAGFDCVRIPVRWDKHTETSSPYRINYTFLQHVEEVIDWGLERDLFVVVNSHHDNWIKENYSNPDYRDRFDSIWSQISVKFKDKSEKLIFEILNEPKGLTKSQNDEMHQRVLSIIRKTNPTRIVIFQGHEWGGPDELVTAAIPDDDYVMGSFHAYTTYHFAQLGEGLWGRPNEISAMRDMFISVKNWSDENNIPVFFGEFGAVHHCDYNSRMTNYMHNVLFAQQYGFAYCAWDNGTNGEYEILERDTKRWNEVKDILLHSTAQSPSNPKIKLHQDTIIHLSWTNTMADYDSIFIQRKESNTNFVRIAALKGDTTYFYDANRFPNKYYYYRIIAYYNSGEQYFSHPVRIFLPIYVPKVREYFLGEPINIPGTVEAEDFDMGGEGFTYHDSNPDNIPGYYRPDEGVDIYDRSGDGYHIGNAVAGEWYEYTVDVEQEGEYNIDVFLASLYGGGTFILKIGEDVSDTLTAPQTFSWMNTKSVSTVMYLAAGEQILRFTVLEDPLFNFDKILFSPVTLTPGIQKSDEKLLNVYQSRNRELVCNIHQDLAVNRIQVYSIGGSLIYANQNPENHFTIPASGIPAGTYIIRALTSEQVLTSKIILK